MAEANANEQPKVEKSPKRLVGILVTAVLVTGAAVAGTILGPRLMAQPAEDESTADAAEPVAEADSEHDAEKGGEPTNPQAFAPIVVDVKAKNGEMHHMKVGITVELPEKATKDEFEKLQPRGREAAIAYLRSRPYEELTDPANFNQLHKDLGEAVIKAMLGSKHVKRFVITDFVSQ